MQHKRITLFAGHYGSGKTNIAVNYALYLKNLGKDVVVADLDIVNPYFRTKTSGRPEAPYRRAMRPNTNIISQPYAIRQP